MDSPWYCCGWGTFRLSRGLVARVSPYWLQLWRWRGAQKHLHPPVIPSPSALAAEPHSPSEQGLEPSSPGSAWLLTARTCCLQLGKNQASWESPSAAPAALPLPG